ncbi:hypothetical protein NK6_5338 [Bradyrhizobium diazoefficiens]|uniref:Uncharacterized protein n=1 Tax=Bradyrhizobium diazoefficiens TaxID=1355477 RepID=A0A0E4FUL7_9BRAD|nr:hypothetical protein NK6_5338 [Bradyrhizobium diazoefficiens]
MWIEGGGTATMKIGLKHILRSDYFSRQVFCAPATSL